MVLTTAPVKIKITKEDGKSELRRLAFGFENDLVSGGGGGRQMQVAYHLSLSRFLLRSLADLYPELPVGGFSGLAVFSVKDEDGDMVRYDSEEEFVAAMCYNSWESCLRVEVTILERSPAAADNATATAEGVPSSADDATAAAAEQPAAAAAASVTVNSEPAPPSEAGSVMSFVSNLSGSSSASSVPSSSTAASASPASGSASAASVASAEEPARSPAPVVAAPAPLEETEAMMPAEEKREVRNAAPSTTDESTPAAADAAAADANAAAAASDATSADATAAAPAPAPASFGDPATPARAFLTQVLPGLADVLARSMYAAQWVPDGVPDTVSAASTAAREGENPLGPAAQGLAAAAATAAASTAARVTSTAHSVATTVQVTAESAAAAAGAPAPAAAVPDVPRTVEPAPAAAAAAAATPASSEAEAGAAGPSEGPAPVVHHGVQCDVCDTVPLIGVRYKCAVRSDFDLCEDCEASAAGRDSPFPFLKIRTPAQAPAAIVCLLKPEQPGSAQEAASTAAAAAAGDNSNNNPRGANSSNNHGAPRSYAPGHAWRGRSKANPQHGGWGEGRRNGHRWMRDLARRQQQHFDRAASSSASGAGIYPPGVEFLRGAGGGGGGCSRPPWYGPRMARRRDDPVPATDAAAVAAVAAAAEAAAAAVAAAVGSDVENKAQAQETGPASSTTPEDPTPPASVAESDADKEADAAAAAAAVEKPAETAAAAPALTTSALQQAAQQPAAEYHDLLAASMRSLADSMTASLPASSGSNPAPLAQDGGASKSRASQDYNKTPSKPMARFVTDVSISDGSPLPPNTRFVKTWCMRNDGQVTFPAGCKMMPVGGDMMGGPEGGVSVEQRVPGEEFHVSVTLTTPPLSGRYIGYWRLRTADGQKFGHRVWADVLVTGGTASLIDEGTMDGDWDLVNMQRLSKAVEDTGKGDAEPEPTPTDNTTPTPEPPAATPASEAAPAAAPPASRTYAPGQAWAPAPKAAAPEAEITATEITANADTTPNAADAGANADTAALSGDGGFEESKSSDEGVETPPPAEQAQVQASRTAVPPPLATKWHRELCSLAEMGFENTSRNVMLLERHVVDSGSAGMERVLHELLIPREASIQ